MFKTASRTGPRLILVFLLAVTLWKVWIGGGEILPAAQAQIPDSGLQRKLLLDEVQKTNLLLQELLTTVRTGTLKVRIEGTDKKAAPAEPGREG